ncbi:TIGR01244 family sulfur transferase [Jiella mangrovi]|uniref:TIGR01244 family phosphatase n=1 Tax=Jiella mangrovi TaxID=2821407 RepID=A0ABS4BJL2_9HYPH|nr:TIGR01244 family sulfur transferase [Jiella mangrovi]MBP0616891.1 TIGR01244 family phosphatase [Jiella mangrovi]
MNAKPLTDQLSVRDQVEPGEIAGLKAEGFRAIIVNRPDGEGPGQPSFAEIEQAAKAAGMEARYIPAVIGQITEADVAAFSAAMEELPKPVAAFCKSGLRSTTLWALSEAGKRPVPDILQRARSAGYDLSGIAERLAKG